MPKTYVLDASAFIYGMFPDGELVTPPRVYEEVRDDASRLKRELLSQLKVKEPGQKYVDEIKNAAQETGDIARLSPSDVDLLALAAEELAEGKDVAMLTDDYAVQNVAKKAGITILPLHQKRIKYNVVWEKRCMGCNRTYKEGDVCEVCGSPLKLKKRSSKR
jgi:endoribonuclease Nob1